MKLKRYVSLLLLLLSPLSLFSTEHVTLQLRWLHQFQFAGYYMALHKGYYREAGLDVTIVEAKGAEHHPVDEVLCGKAHYGIGNAGILAERLSGKPLVALASLFQTSPNVWILRKDSNISTIVDLADKRLMMTKNIENTELLALFSNEGFDISKLTILESSYNIHDLIDKKVDAFNGYITNEPYYLEQQGIEYTIVDPRKYGVDFYSDILFTSQKELNEHPKRVRAFRDASLKGWEYALANKEESIDVILKHYSNAKTREHLRFEAEAIYQLMQPKFIQIGHMNPARWHYIAQTYQNLGFVTQGDVPNDFLYTPDSTKEYRWLVWAFGITLGLVVFISFITLYIYRLNRKIKEQAIRDPLTGLYNRHYLSETLPHELALASREGYSVAFVMLDLDHFKIINDTYGHAAGDLVLQAIATTLTQNVRPSDFICRFGGEEILVIMPKVSSTQALERMQAFREQVQNTPILYHSKTIHVTLSGGIALFDLDGATKDEVIKAADDALYVSKANGRNQITLAKER